MQWDSVWSLARLLFPFAALVAVSRLIVGLHYHPSDVIAGGLIGGLIALSLMV